MKKQFFYILGFFFLFSVTASAEDDFFDDLIMTDEIKQQAEEVVGRAEGQLKASELLDQKPIKLQIDENAKIQIKEDKFKEETPEPFEMAPFGLKWLAPLSEIEYMKVELTKTNIKDSPNSYLATNLPKPLKSFREVLLSFGHNDTLWRIAAYGNFIEDDISASKGLAEYQKFYDILKDKYGNPQEFYTPAVINIDEEKTADDGTVSHFIKQKLLEKGADGFKEKLMSGESTLFSTFEGDHIGVTLALLADGNGYTYIIIDYKNLKMQDIELKEIYDAL